MKEVRAVRQAQSKPRASGGSPLAESIHNPLSDQGVVDAWKRLAEAGKKDWTIATILAREHGVSPKTIEGKVRRLRKAGLIGQNPNKKETKFKPTQLINESRGRMMEEGKCDGAIAREIAGRTGADLDTLKTTICSMVRKGKIPPNPNNQVTVTSAEYRWFRKRRKELQGIGLTDTSISRILACESEIRNEQAIRRIFWEMVGDGTLGKNTNRGGKEFEKIIVRRYELMRLDFDDQEIARKIARERGRLRPTIGLII